MASGKEHEVKGKGEQIKGAVKEGFGAATNDRSTEIDGKLDRAKGKVQEKYGQAKQEIEKEKNRP